MSFDLSELPVSKQLYPIARQFPFWKDGVELHGLPVLVVDRADLLQPEVRQDEADSWHALLDKKYEGKISAENIPTDMMAIAGRRPARSSRTR